MPQPTLKIAAGLLVAILAPATAAHAIPAIGLAGGTSIFSFDTTTPASSGPATAITGLSLGETLYAIDFRPATSALYGLSTAGRLYTIDTASGAATLSSTLTVALSGNSFDIAFNPTVDRLRIVGTSNQDLRVDVTTGVTTVDGAIAYTAGDANAGRTATVTAVGYTNQVAGATSTTLYDLDPANAALTTQAPPNNGTLNTVGTLSPTGLLSLDIAGGTNAAFAATNSALYALNLGTGATTLIGGFGRSDVTDFALSPTSVPEPVTIGLLGIALAGLAAQRRRSPKPAIA